MSGQPQSKRKRILRPGAAAGADDEFDDYSAGIMSEINKFSQVSADSSKKHTLDSDEEEDLDEINRKKHRVLQDDEIEGQEDSEDEGEGGSGAGGAGVSLASEAGVKITPFNMKDELEEGYFDGSGMYIWNKRDGAEVKDSWLDSVDWVELQKGKGGKDAQGRREDEDEAPEPTADQTIGLYQKILAHLKPGETILRAIKRLGGSTTSKTNLSASERLKLRKEAQKNAKAKKLENPIDFDNDDLEAESKKQKSKSSGSGAAGGGTGASHDTPVSQLTGLANDILGSTGHMDVYQETWESINFKIQEHEKLTQIPTKAEDDGRDMFSDEFT